MKTTDRALMLDGFLPESRGRELLAQHGRTAEHNDLSGSDHSAGRVVHGQRIVENVVATHLAHVERGAHEERKAKQVKTHNMPTL